jgi:hypothetical protein
MAKATEQTALKLTGDFRVEPNERDPYNRVRSWRVLGRDGKRFITTKTRQDAAKLSGILARIPADVLTEIGL